MDVFFGGGEVKSSMAAVAPGENLILSDFGGGDIRLVCNAALNAAGVLVSIGDGTAIGCAARHVSLSASVE